MVNWPYITFKLRSVKTLLREKGVLAKYSKSIWKQNKTKQQQQQNKHKKKKKRVQVMSSFKNL